MSAFQDAVNRETAKVRAHLDDLATHFVAIGPEMCIYCGLTMKQLEAYPMNGVPRCEDVMATKKVELVGLQSIVDSSGIITKGPLA